MCSGDGRPGRGTSDADGQDPGDDSRLTTYLMLIAATVGWGVSGPTVKYAVEDLAPMTAAVLRFGFGSLLLLLILWRRGEAWPLPRSAAWPPILGLGLFGVTLFGALYTAGLQWTGAAEGILINGTSPLITILLAAVLVGEPLRRAGLAGAVVAFAGLAALVLGGSAEWGIGQGRLRLIGDVLMFGSAVAWAGYSVGVRLARGRFSLMQTSAYSVFAGSLLLVPFALFETPRMPLAEVRLMTWLAIGYQVVVASCLSYLWWNEGIRRIGAARASTFGYVGPVTATLTAWLLLGEQLTPLQIFGAALILCGLFIANHR